MTAKIGVKLEVTSKSVGPRHFVPVTMADNQKDATTGEVTLSVEETNKLRISLGLKPLEETPDNREHQEKARFDEKKKEEQKRVLKEKLKAAREKKEEERFFRGTKTLGEIETPDDDDIATWIQKTRTQEAKSKVQNEIKNGSTSSSSTDDESEEEGLIVPEIVGKKVKHKTGDIKIGETMVLTLEDQPILDQKGELNTMDDALENILKAEDSKRRKAYRSSKLQRDDGFDLQGKKKDLLSKYDEEEEEAMTLDPVFESFQDKDPNLKKESLHTTLHQISDYIGEIDDHIRPTKRRKKKLRKKPESEVLDIVADLEAHQDDNMDWEANHGSRIDRHLRLQQIEDKEKTAKERKTQQFDKALEKANLESLKLKFQAEDVEEDEEMSEALARAQTVAKQKKRNRFEELAEDAKTKSTDQPQIKTEQKNLIFTDTSEFCRLIAGETQDLNKQPSLIKEEKEEDDLMTEDIETQKTKPERRRHLRSKPQPIKSQEAPEDDGALREPVLGTGLAAALNTLRDKGDLKQKFEWVGRTNDMKKSRLIGVDDFYTCGETDDSLEKNIETALTRKDPLGRVLTPKEAFRAISYAFHGKGPSQKTLEKRRKKMNDDFLANRINLDQESQLTRLKAVQKVQKNPFVLLTGTGQIGKELREEKKKTSKKAKAEARAEYPSLTPVLHRNTNGGTTPQEGRKKGTGTTGSENKSYESSTILPIRNI